MIALVGYFIFVGIVMSTSKNTPAQEVYMATPASSAVLSAVSSETRPYIEAINKIRISNGVNPLLYSPELEQIANKRVVEMSQSSSYSHTRGDGSNFISLLPEEKKKKYACENLQLQLSDSLDEAMSAWMTSSAHKKCLLQEQIAYAGMSHTVFGDIATDEDTYVVFTFIGAN